MWRVAGYLHFYRQFGIQACVLQLELEVWARPLSAVLVGGHVPVQAQFGRGLSGSLEHIDGASIVH